MNGKGADQLIKKLRNQKRRLTQLNSMKASVGAIKDVPEHTPEELQKIVRFNEFGTSNIPARSFLRGTAYRNNKYGWRFVANDGIKRVLAGTMTGHAVYRRIGDRMVDDVHKQIDAIGPPNAPATIKAKGRNQPLVDSGGLYRSIDKEVIHK